MHENHRTIFHFTVGSCRSIPFIYLVGEILALNWLTLRKYCFIWKRQIFSLILKSIVRKSSATPARPDQRAYLRFLIVGEDEWLVCLWIISARSASREHLCRGGALFSGKANFLPYRNLQLDVVCLLIGLVQRPQRRNDDQSIIKHKWCCFLTRTGRNSSSREVEVLFSTLKHLLQFWRPIWTFWRLTGRLTSQFAWKIILNCRWDSVSICVNWL